MIRKMLLITYNGCRKSTPRKTAEIQADESNSKQTTQNQFDKHIMLTKSLPLPENRHYTKFASNCYTQAKSSPKFELEQKFSRILHQ